MDFRRPFKSRIGNTCLRAILASAALASFVCLGAGATRAADVDKGKAAFVRQCAICHTVERGGANGIGPNLFGIVGRKAGTMAGFSYSRPFSTTATWIWNEGLLGPWISLPNVMVPGTTMGVFQGVADRDKDDIVVYLAVQK
jgi:cytochrome c